MYYGRLVVSWIVRARLLTVIFTKYLSIVYWDMPSFRPARSFEVGVKKKRCSGVWVYFIVAGDGGSRALHAIRFSFFKCTKDLCIFVIKVEMFGTNNVFLSSAVGGL